MLLGAGQDGEAVVDGVGQAGGVVHLDEVGHQPRGDDDAQNNLRQLVGDLVSLAVRHGLLAPAEDGLGAHGAEGDAHGVGVGGHVPPGGGGALKVLGHGVPHAGPQVLHRGVGDNLRVDEDVTGRDFGEGVLPQAAVRVVQNAQAGTARAGGGDGGEGEKGPVGHVGQHLHRVDGLAAAHGKEHIRLGHLGLELGDVLHRGLSPVPVGAGDFHRRARHRLADFLLRRGQGPLAADDGRLLSKGGAHGGDVLIGVLPDGVAGEQCLLEIHSQQPSFSNWPAGAGVVSSSGSAAWRACTASS